MHQSFSHALLITCFLFAVSCKPPIVVSSVNTTNIVVSEGINPLDSQLVQIYLPKKKILEKDMGRVIAVSKTQMEKDKPESNLTNFLADLLLSQGKLEAQKSGLGFAPSVSFFNYGGIRAPLPKGNITVGNIYELMPFENEMVFVALNGIQMQDFFNLITERGGDSLGGARFVIRNGKATEVSIGGEELQPQKTYWMVTNDYVAGGGDGMEMLAESHKIVPTGKLIRNIIISDLEKSQNINQVLMVELDGRIGYE